MLGQIRMVSKWGLCWTLWYFLLCTQRKEVSEVIRITNVKFFHSAISSFQHKRCTGAWHVHRRVSESVCGSTSHWGRFVARNWGFDLMWPSATKTYIPPAFKNKIWQNHAIMKHWGYSEVHFFALIGTISKSFIGKKKGHSGISWTQTRSSCKVNKITNLLRLPCFTNSFSQQFHYTKLNISWMLKS